MAGAVVLLAPRCPRPLLRHLGERGVNAADNWNFSAASVCFQELAVVPVGRAWTGDTVNHCANGNVLNHAG